MRLTKCAIPIHLVLNTAVMDGSRQDAGGLRTKAMYNHRPNFPTARATPQKLHIANSRKKNNTYLWCEWQQSWLEQWPPTRGVELSSAQNCQTSMKNTMWSGWGPCTAPGSHVGNSCLRNLQAVIAIYDFLVMKRGQSPDGQHAYV